ncbi:MAG: ABC transporter ATP-binding protein [Candidatus Altiarchaeales archaeon ex4484_2]|nr:MAG: ABC transporter ATP-binding protein [Candidatus Altiarchaeales archaeon ex4484_2]
MLEVKDINVSYGKVQVLWDLSLNVGKGEIVTLLGSNGAGKTTTVKAVTGLLHPSSGSIKFLNENIEKLPPYKIVKKGVTLVPEGMASFPRMSVIENLLMGAYTRQDSADDTLEQVYQIFPKLRERDKQRADTLSGGEQRMLAIGKALMSKPKLIILDEPSLGLAPNLVLTLLDVIRKLREERVNVLLVEQNVHHALEISDRGYVLEKGRMILDGKSSDLLTDDYVKKSYLGI